jgi:hypothetical protein
MSQHDDYRDLIRRFSESPEWVDALMELFRAANRFSRIHSRVAGREWPRWLDTILREPDPPAETFVDTFAERATARANAEEDA